MKDPYVYEGTNVLINLAEIKNQTQLDNVETKYQTIKDYNLDKYEYNYHHIKK